MEVNKEQIKYFGTRTGLRSLGIALISYGITNLGTNTILAVLSIICGLIILGIKDYLE